MFTVVYSIHPEHHDTTPTSKFKFVIEIPCKAMSHKCKLHPYKGVVVHPRVVNINIKGDKIARLSVKVQVYTPQVLSLGQLGCKLGCCFLKP